MCVCVGVRGTVEVHRLVLYCTALHSSVCRVDMKRELRFDGCF